MTGKKLIYKILLLSSLIVGCATTTYSTFDYDYPIVDIQKAVASSLPEGLGATNSNRRIFYSKKFTVNQDKKGNVPLIMRIIVTGDRRPYGLEVDVKKVSPSVANIEEAFNFGEDFKGQISLAKRVVTKIDDQLAQRRKNKNLFDDFRAF